MQVLQVLLVLPAVIVLAGCDARASSKGAPPARAGACGDCHVQIQRESLQSLHGRSRSDPSYVAALARESDKGFCEQCHDPTGNGTGVGCGSCHATFHGQVRAVVTSQACAPCHDFPFPARTDAMQLTFAEHAVSPNAETPCATCHMKKERGGPASHAFAASRDASMLARAVVVTGQREPDGDVTLWLTQGQIGHAFPTGDLFRRLLLVVERVGPTGERLDFAQATVGRTFGADHGKKVQIVDNRPGSPRNQGGPRTQVRLHIPRGSEQTGTVVRYRLSYERVADALSDSALVEESMLVTQGIIP